MQTIASATGKILGDLAKSGVVSFETGKALQIAQLLIETPAAAFAAYRSLVGIPIVGPALASAAFATAMITGMAQIANIKKQKPPKAEKGGFLTGPSHNQGGILIEAEGNEYITNKKRVSELGKGFFDFINFAPLDRVKDAISNFQMPSFYVPAMPQFAYSTGGYVNSNFHSTNAVESKIDTLIDKIMDGFDRLDKKDYNIHIKSHMDGVKYIRQHDKYREEHDRKTK